MGWAEQGIGQRKRPQICIDNYHRIPAVQRDVLRSIAMCHAHELAESRLGVLKAPAAARRLRKPLLPRLMFF